MSDPGEPRATEGWALLGLVAVLIIAMFIPAKVYLVLFLVVAVPLVISLWLFSWYMQVRSFSDIVRTCGTWVSGRTK